MKQMLRTNNMFSQARETGSVSDSTQIREGHVIGWVIQKIMYLLEKCVRVTSE